MTNKIKTEDKKVQLMPCKIHSPKKSIASIKAEGMNKPNGDLSTFELVAGYDLYTDSDMFDTVLLLCDVFKKNNFHKGNEVYDKIKELKLLPENYFELLDDLFDVFDCNFYDFEIYISDGFEEHDLLYDVNTEHIFYKQVIAIASEVNRKDDLSEYITYTELLPRRLYGVIIDYTTYVDKYDYEDNKVFESYIIHIDDFDYKHNKDLMSILILMDIHKSGYNSYKENIIEEIKNKLSDDKSLNVLFNEKFMEKYNYVFNIFMTGYIEYTAVFSDRFEEYKLDIHANTQSDLYKHILDIFKLYQ